MMIFPLSTDHNWGFNYILSLDEIIDEQDFLNRAGVNDGAYAGELLKEIHNGIFNSALDLKRDYETYYNVEYESFSHYLKKRLFLTPGECQSIEETYAESCAIVLFKPHHSFVEDEYGESFLKRILMRKVRS